MNLETQTAVEPVIEFRALASRTRVGVDSLGPRAPGDSGRAHRIRRGREMNQNQIIASFVRAATWQLMRRSPTWILIVVVAAAWLIAGHH